MDGVGVGGGPRASELKDMISEEAFNSAVNMEIEGEKRFGAIHNAQTVYSSSLKFTEPLSECTDDHQAQVKAANATI